MLFVYSSLCALLLCTAATSAVSDREFQELKDLVTRIYDRQKNVIISLARQVGQQQLHVEEATRSYGDSGLKLSRLVRTGSKPYFSTTFTGNRVAAIHEHSNYKATVGMGEFIAVLNGVEFRTRHNDYKMRMPSRNSTEYGATEDIPYPDVPPEVLAQPTVESQIIEMREWFKAWQNGDHSVRDYRKYFRPNLCYLEGQWTNADIGEIDEPYFSERHAIDAKSFFDLQNKIRYTSVTGRKSTKENYAYLPTTIADVDDYGNIVYSQWNYQILCHPIKDLDVPISRLKVEDDLSARVANGKTLEEFSKQRAARFSLYQDPKLKSPSTKDAFVKHARGTYLDRIMAEIPGKDNYPADLVDNAFGNLAYAKDANLPESPKTDPTRPDPLNVGFYHNAYKVVGKDAMGVSIRRRGFSDNNLYVAYNTQSKVTAVKVKDKCIKNEARARCMRINKRICASFGSQNTRCSRARTCPSLVCPEYSHRVSYAIPLELIYTTPLQTWNPYNFTIYSEIDKMEPATPVAGTTTKRRGGLTTDTAYLGVSPRFYSMTPIEFFDNSTMLKDAADTTKKGAVGVIDNTGVVRKVIASGISIMTRNIPGVGPARIRYPIMPLHDTGTTLYKDLQALAEMTLRKDKYLRLYPDTSLDNSTLDQTFSFELPLSSIRPPRPHIHIIDLTESEINALKAGETVTTSTSEVAGHDHVIVLEWVESDNSIRIFSCDGEERRCWDGHRGAIHLERRFGSGN